jgi:dihydrofolate synthase/folylpolyglutamate synthase
MTYREALARLLALRGGEVQGMRPGLERIRTLLEALGHPETQYRLAQVGGTNGKGSTSAMLAAILRAHGWRTGLYTSPHLACFRERIRVDGACIAPGQVVDGVEAIGTLVARLDATMFEAATALALDHFAREGVEVAVLEVGLGGRLDSTTVGRPEVAVLGPVDYDHQAILGPTLTHIATEKAGIIRSGTALSARQAPEAAQVIERRAAAVGVPLLVEGRDLAVTVRSQTLAGQRVDLAGPGWRLEDVSLALLGVYQPSNALLAAAAAWRLGAGEAAIRRGLAEAVWPGRFQVLAGDPVLVLDAAHNPAGARALAASLRHYFPGAAIALVVGSFADKDLEGILGTLAPLASRLVLTAFDHPRAASPDTLQRHLVHGAGDLPGGVHLAGSVAEALERARPGAEVICVAGSVALVGQVLAGRPEARGSLCEEAGLLA